jgi:type I restriction enzyme, S subunit
MKNLIQSIFLRDIINLDKGKPPAQQKYYGPDADIYLTPDYLRGGVEPEQIKPSSNAIHVENGDTIVLWDGSNAGEIFRAKKGILSSTMAKVSYGEDYDKEYFFYALKGCEEYLKGQTSGSGIPHVDKDVLGKIALIGFPKPEQSKIASVLSTVDRAIEQTEGLIAKQQRIKTGLMQDLLTRGIDEHGHLRSKETHEFKDSPLGRIPVEWEVSPAYTLCSAVVDCKNRTPPLRSDGYPVIRTPNVRDGRFIYDDLAFTNKKSFEIWTARGKPRVGDVIITREAPFGEACLIPHDICNACLGQRMMMYQTDPSLLDHKYLVYTIYSERIQKRLFELAGGSTVGHIRVGDIRNLPIAHPLNVEEQLKISNILSGVDILLEQSRKELIKYSALKKGLMQDLITGKVRVTPLLEDKYGC